MGELTKLFEPIKIGSLEVKNRIFMGEAGPLGDGHGRPTQQTIDFYVRRVRGGAGLVMVGGSYPAKVGATSQWGTWLFEDSVLEAWMNMTQALRKADLDVRIGVQLLHCGRQKHVHAEGAMGDYSVAPSAIPYQFGIVPHVLTTEEVEETVNQYVEAAWRAREAGFDCIGLHGAHGYMISQFISPYTNRRSDKYGGSAENRARFACEIIEGIKHRCGREFPVLIKINQHDYMKDVDAQIDLDHTRSVVPLLEKSGADEIHISGGQHESYLAAAVGPYTIPRAFFAGPTGEIKKIARVPVGLICRINDPVLGEQILKEGNADIIWMTRPLMADPDLPSKAKAGKLDQIRTCIGCCTCIDMLWDRWIRDYRCALNPEMMRERVLQQVRTSVPKKVLVIGGGPAGCEAACGAAEIGHKVTLWEKQAQLGGQVNLAAIAPSKYEYKNIPRYHQARLAALGVQIELGKEATAQLVKEMNPDVVILATGSVSRTPSVKGATGQNVVDAREVIAGNVGTGSRVIIVGGGVVGLETAEVLVGAGKKVTVVARTKVGRGMVRMIYHIVRSHLQEAGTEILSNTPILEIDATGVTVAREAGPVHLEADTVVLATGARASRDLLDELEDLVPEIHVVGDALKPRNIMTAIYQGALSAKALDDYHPRKWK